MGGPIAVGAVSGGAHQTDRLSTVETPNEQIAIEAVTTRTAPGSHFSDIETGGEISNLTTETETVAAGDVLVVEIASTGLSNALASESVTDPNARLLELVQSGDLEARIARSASNTSLDLSATDKAGGLRVLPEKEGSGVFILIDTERAVFDGGTGVSPGDHDVIIGGNGTDEPVSERVTVTERNASFETDEDGRINLTADTNRTITGNTTVAPDTELTVHVQSNEEATFNITRTARVKEDGSFSLRVDFGNVTKGTKFAVSIPGGGFSGEASTDGVLTAASSASVSLTSQRFETDGSQTVVVESANLSGGGFLAVYNQSFLTQNSSEAQESYQGVSTYRQPGSHSNVSITLDGDYEGEGTVIVVPHLDTNDNGEYDGNNASIDRPYQGADGGPIIAVANVSTGTGDGGTHSTAAPSPGPSNANAEPGETGATTDNRHTDTSADNDPGSHRNGSHTSVTDGERSTDAQLSEADGPGFGPLVGLIGVVITALLVALARRP